MLRITTRARIGASQLSSTHQATRLSSSLGAATVTNSEQALPTSLSADQKPYFVQRTQSQLLPVYHESKGAGNKHLTVVRKVTGQVEELKKELVDALKLKEDDIKINPINRHVIIKGHIKKQVAAYLAQARF